MRVNRKELLGALEAVSPGLATREEQEQSSCFVFQSGSVWTYNEEILCHEKSPLGDIEAAIVAKPLLSLLSKLKEDEIEVECRDNELLIRGKVSKGEGRQSGLRVESKIRLSIDDVEKPAEWFDLPEEFSDAASKLHACVSKKKDEFKLTCVHFTPNFAEATDRFHACRYGIKTPIEKPLLIRGECLQEIIQCAVTQISVTESWVHFKNKAGLKISMRKFDDIYPNIDVFFSPKDSKKLKLPGDMEEVVSKAQIFSGFSAAGDDVLVTIRPGKISIKGQGTAGWFEERKAIDYEGDEIKFKVDPKLLTSIAKKSNECRVADGRMLIKGEKFVYVVEIGVV